MRYVLCYLIRVLRPHTLVAYAAAYVPHALRSMLPHTCLKAAYTSSVCCRIRAACATFYATSCVPHTLRSMLPQGYFSGPKVTTYATSYVPHTLRMLPQGYFSGPKVTYIREVGASDFVRCPIRYVCYLIRAPYATYATSYVPHTLRTSERSAPPTSSGASYATYATSYMPHTLCMLPHTCLIR
jgi:hypothetical protein